MHKKTEPLYAIELDRRDRKRIPILVNYGVLSNYMSGPRLFYYRSDARSYAREHFSNQKTRIAKLTVTYSWQ